MKRLFLAPVWGLFFAFSTAAAPPRTPGYASQIGRVDVALIGAGIMSATLGTLLKELDPSLKMTVFERLDRVAIESSDAYNNAGTGHAALCELNYTPECADGSIEIQKALQINASFEESKQFWATLAQRGLLGDPKQFIHSVPHLSWVEGQDSVNYLQKRYIALRDQPLFAGMQFTQDPVLLEKWVPLLMQGRIRTSPVAATRSELGTDVDFGRLSQQLFEHLRTQAGATLLLQHEIRGLKQKAGGEWQIRVRDLKRGRNQTVLARHVFIGAGGGALPLLQSTGLELAQSYGGFPIAGQFLMTKNPKLVQQHDAKVYGLAAVGAPPMSVPHLDTRIIDGQRVLLFGPFAGVSTKFLKHGSGMDLFRSVHWRNLDVMFKAGTQNLPLVGYLVDQATQGQEDRLEVLRQFVPDARLEDWELITAGQRVQILKDQGGEKGVLQFGTEVVASPDGTLTALLGASPGASTSVSVMLDVLRRSFALQMQSIEWQKRLRALIPSYGKDLTRDAKLLQRVRHFSHQVLGLVSPDRCHGLLQSRKKR